MLLYSGVQIGLQSTIFEYCVHVCIVELGSSFWPCRLQQWRVPSVLRPSTRLIWSCRLRRPWPKCGASCLRPRTSMSAPKPDHPQKPHPRPHPQQTRRGRERTFRRAKKFFCGFSKLLVGHSDGLADILFVTDVTITFFF